MIALTKYKNTQKNTAVSAVSKTYTYWGGVNVLNGGVITTIKDVIYI